MVNVNVNNLHGGGFVASGEGPKTSCAFKLGQLLHVRLKSTGDTTSGEGSAPGLRHTIVAGDHRPPQCSTDKGVRSARWHQSPADTCCVTVLACQEDLANTHVVHSISTAALCHGASAVPYE